MIFSRTSGILLLLWPLISFAGNPADRTIQVHVQLASQGLSISGTSTWTLTLTGSLGPLGSFSNTAVTSGLLLDTAGTAAQPFAPTPLPSFPAIPSTTADRIQDVVSSDELGKLYSAYYYDPIYTNPSLGAVLVIGGTGGGISGIYLPPPPRLADILADRAAGFSGNSFTLNESGEILLLSGTANFSGISPKTEAIAIVAEMEALPSPATMGRLKKVRIQFAEHEAAYDIDLDQYTYDGQIVPVERGVTSTIGPRTTLNALGSLRVALSDSEHILLYSPSLSIKEQTPLRAKPDVRVGASAFSSAIGDPTDPLKTAGLRFDLSEFAWHADLVIEGITATTKAFADRLVQAYLNVPATIGYANTAFYGSPGGWMGRLNLKIGVSANAEKPATTRYHHGMSSPTAALAADPLVMWVADAEQNAIRAYFRSHSGKPFELLSTVGAYLGVPATEQLAFRGVARYGTLAYWIGEHSAATASQNVYAAGISYAFYPTFGHSGYYRHLRSDLIAYDQANQHELGSDALGLNTAASGDLFRIGGLTTASPGTFLVAFESPTPNTRALLIPVLNLPSICTHQGGTPGTAQFEPPILLDLKGRGIRSIVRTSAGSYYILAACNEPAAPDFRVYSWSGKAASAPIEILAPKNSPGCLVEDVFHTGLQMLSDDAEMQWYGDGVAAKDLSLDDLKKFRSTWLVGLPQPFVPKSPPGNGATIPVENPIFIPEPPTVTYLPPPPLHIQSRPKFLHIKAKKGAVTGFVHDSDGDIIRLEYRVGRTGRFKKISLKGVGKRKYSFAIRSKDLAKNSLTLRAIDAAGSLSKGVAKFDGDGEMISFIGP